MKSSRPPADSERPDSSQVSRLSSIPRHIEEWLDAFFDGSPTVRFTCTPQFYEHMYFRLREAASEHGYDPDLIVGRGGTLEFRLRASGREAQTVPAQDESVHEASSSPNRNSANRNEPQIIECASPDELMTRLELLRDNISHESAHRRELARRAVAAGIKKSRVYINAGVTPPTLNRWLRDDTSDGNDHEPDRHLILRRLQVANTHIRSSKALLRELASEAALAIKDVSKVARAAGISRQAIYRWLRIRKSTNG